MKHLPSFLTAVCYDFKMLLVEEKYKLIARCRWYVFIGFFSLIKTTPLSLVCFYRFFSLIKTTNGWLLTKVISK
jgi:hypothetical protein